MNTNEEKQIRVVGQFLIWKFSFTKHIELRYRSRWTTYFSETQDKLEAA